MKLTNKGLTDRRFSQLDDFNFWQNHGLTICAVLLGIATAILLSTLYPHRTSPKPPESKIELKVEEVKAAETPCDYDPLTYLRCRGKQLGVDDYTISKIIRMITTCENSKLNPEAINVNTDKHRSLDVGIMQINMYWHRNEVKLVDMLDFKKNIDFGYKIFLEQGFEPWSCAHKLGFVK